MKTFEPLDTIRELGTLLHVLSEHLLERFGKDSNLDVQQISSLATAGLLQVFVMREEGIIVGYTAYLLYQELFRVHVRIAECIAVYMKPEFRSAVNTKNLIKFSERMLQGHKGVHRILTSTNQDPRLQRFYERLGYKALNTLVAKDT